MDNILTESQQLIVLGEMSFAFMFTTLDFRAAQGIGQGSYVEVTGKSPNGHIFTRFIRRPSICGLSTKNDYEWDQWLTHPQY